MRGINGELVWLRAGSAAEQGDSGRGASTISAWRRFRLNGIIHGVKKRLRDGNASSAKAERTVARVVPLAEAAWVRACLAGAR